MREEMFDVSSEVIGGEAAPDQGERGSCAETNATDAVELMSHVTLTSFSHTISPVYTSCSE